MTPTINTGTKAGVRTKESDESGSAGNADMMMEALRFLSMPIGFQTEEGGNEAFRAGAAAANDPANAAAGALGMGVAFLGGGCCIHLSVEYLPTIAAGGGSSAVLLYAKDSEQTVMAWGKTVTAGSAYTIKECVISTKPGATLAVVVFNAIARVRWCEVFSC